MDLNFKLEDVNLDNYNKVIEEINIFRNALDKKCDALKMEMGKALLEDLKTEPIRSIENCTLHKVERFGIQELFCESIEDMGFDSYGFYNSLENEELWFENDTFMLRPYSWSESDCSCGLDEKENEYYLSNNKHKDLGLHAIDCYNCSDRIVNFWYKPTNLKIYWYKYPMRSAYANQKINYNYLRAMLDDCKNSMKK